MALLNIRPLYYKMTFPNYDAFDEYDWDDYGIEDDLATCAGWYTDIEIAPIHAYLQGNVASCILSFIHKLWHIRDPEVKLEIYCGFDDQTIMRGHELLLFRGWRGTWTIWDFCLWL